MKNLSNKIYLLIDCLFLSMALFISLLIKFDGRIPVDILRIIPFSLIITIIVSLPIFYIFGIYSLLWNYASVEELVRIILATLVSSIGQLLLAAYFDTLFPYSVYIIGWMITFLFVGGREKIIKTSVDMSIEEIILAIPSITRKETLEIIDICQKTRCKLKVLPSVYGIVNEEVSIKEIRDVTVEDLLQRDEISLSIEEISGYLKGETILVTGGGGSIGTELCRQIASYEPESLLIFDIYENNAYELQNELMQKYKDQLDIKVIIGSIRDKKRLDYVFSQYKPGIVFHAAAHKHVPLMEFNPQEAVKNNVFGTLNLAECAHHYNCKKFVLISTDKAVNPTSIMGATKRIAELIIQYMNSVSNTKFSAVRFGNVLGSNGSVIPLFKKQIEKGGPITITHPEVTRFFMTIPEAVSLVIQSGAMMEGGEIFILDMGKPVKIIDLARSLISLSGLVPDVDIDIEYIGLRPGEKLYEELVISDEGVNVTRNDKIFIEKSEKIDLESYIKKIKTFELDKLDDASEVVKFISKLIPSYQNK